MSFTHFHERGFTIPAHKFLWGLLDYYQVELQHLTPNGVQHIAAFIALCEGFLGISPHFDLWRHFFAVSLSKKRVGKPELSTPIGCASIHLRNTRASDYLLMRLSTSNKGWHSQWFYIKNDVTAPLPVYTKRLIEQALGSWRWGVPDKDKKRIKDHLPLSKF